MKKQNERKIHHKHKQGIGRVNTKTETIMYSRHDYSSSEMQIVILHCNSTIVLQQKSE